MATTLYVQITDLTGQMPPWYSSTALRCSARPEQHVVALNRKAKRMGVAVSYALATEEAYWAYRSELKARTLAGKY